MGYDQQNQTNNHDLALYMGIHSKIDGRWTVKEPPFFIQWDSWYMIVAVQGTRIGLVTNNKWQAMTSPLRNLRMVIDFMLRLKKIGVRMFSNPEPRPSTRLRPVDWSQILQPQLSREPGIPKSPWVSILEGSCWMIWGTPMDWKAPFVYVVPWAFQSTMQNKSNHHKNLTTCS